MISEKRKLEFWNFLIEEKNQPRPKGITTQRLAVIRPLILRLDEVWLKVIGPDNNGERSAVDFYESKEPESVISRTEFWSAVRKFIRQGEIKIIQQNQPPKPKKHTRRNTNSHERRK
jgi:hypothetical protein